MKPKSWLILSVAALAATVAVTVARAAPEAVAFVVAIRGRVDVTPAGARQAQRADLGRPLARGDRVQVGPASRASIFFSDGNVIELAEKSSITISGRVAARKAGVELSAEVFQSVSKGLVGGSRETGLVALAPMRGAEADETPLILSPRRSDVLEDRPTFTWRTLEGAKGYRVTVLGDAGELWSRETQGGSLAYPADAPALPVGTELLWEVEVLADGATVRREETMFRVLPGTESREVRGHLARIQEAGGGEASEAAHFLSGSYLAGLGLYGDAAQHFQALCGIAPESPGPHEALGNVYRRVGLMDLAAAEFQKALALSRSP